LFNNISALNESNHYTAKALQQYESYHNKISDQINYMLQLQADTEQQIDEQYNQHIKMNERLENQEALTEKTIRQLDQLRANLFERTNYLVDRVEESYHLTSTYIYELLKGSNQPFTFFISEEKSEDKKNCKSFMGIQLLLNIVSCLFLNENIDNMKLLFFEIVSSYKRNYKQIFHFEFKQNFNIYLSNTPNELSVFASNLIL